MTKEQEKVEVERMREESLIDELEEEELKKSRVN